MSHHSRGSTVCAHGNNRGSRNPGCLEDGSVNSEQPMEEAWVGGRESMLGPQFGGAGGAGELGNPLP